MPYMPSLPYGKSRSMTPMETVRVSKIFGQSIKAACVKIHHGKYIGIQPNGAAMTPNGEIYFPTPLYADDYSSIELPRKRHHLFIHEMVHVWQYQLGYPVAVKGLLESLIGTITHFGYDYDLKPDTKLSDYPMEAQANIIADYAMYVLFNRSDDPVYCSRWDYKKRAYKLSELEPVLTDFINNPSDKRNLPKEIKNSYCEAEPNIANCLTR